MRVEVVNNPRHVLDLMREFYPEMVLLDLNMPDCKGYELARLIRLNPEWIKVAIAYLSSEQDDHMQAEAQTQSGEDFLTKPISDVRLVSAVKVRAARSRQLSDAIDRDSLTGLLTHARIKEQLAMELLRARRAGQPLSVAMLDLDFFKRVNDTYGHAAGDRVIKSLAQLLRQRLRSTDSVGRYGGEEFVAILPGCDVQAATDLLESIRESLKRVSFNAGDKTFSVTLSAGVACCHPRQGDPDSASLLNMADKALYQAKNGGRDRICTVSGGPSSQD